MLVFFIHGVATQNANYSEALSKLVREDLNRQHRELPFFYPSFWGDVLKDKNKIWNCILSDLRIASKRFKKTDASNLFRYQNFREGFLSDFVGDMLTYLNDERGFRIRRKLTDQLYDFILRFPDQENLHIVAHSLGTVILFDMLFSNRFKVGDPVFEFRSLIKGLSHSLGIEPPRKINLRSVTTMGAPILFFNTMLNVDSETINGFFRRYQGMPLRWVNLVHASDLIAYPLGSSFSIDLDSKHVFFRDKYISEDANFAEGMARTLGQLETAMALGASDAHGSYWSHPIAVKLVSANITADTKLIDMIRP